MDIKQELQSLANPRYAERLQGFFKTSFGQYGEGDIFLGIKVPVQREVAKKYYHLSFDELQELLSSKIHEQRLTALFILISKFKKANKNERADIFEFYLKNTKNINNWDLVDLSAPNIMGEYLQDKDRRILYKLAGSENLWERRISILATFTFIKEHDFKDSVKIAETLMNDKHDLIHKAVGWMLREIGKIDKGFLESFLKQHYRHMPRTMLRYTIEKFSEKERREYLAGEK